MTDYNSLEEAFNRLALMTERDALAQQLAASEEIKDSMRHEIRGLSYELAARDKLLVEAAELLDETWNINPDAYDEEELHDRVDAFLTTIEAKAND